MRAVRLFVSIPFMRNLLEGHGIYTYTWMARDVWSTIHTTAYLESRIQARTGKSH